MEEDTSSLDVEYKRYLQIMRPYLGQLLDHDAIDICNAWIQRLSNCSEKEKPMRNKYIFVLCYQLSKGILDEPFLKFPPIEELSIISETNDSDSSTETEYVVVDGDDPKTKVLFKKPASDTEYLSQSNVFDKGDSSIDFDSKRTKKLDDKCSATRQQTILCYTCPELMRSCAEDVSDDQYEFRANNLIMRLREIKKQNLLLNDELLALKEESKPKPGECSGKLITVDHTTSTLRRDNSTTLTSLKNKLMEVQDDRQNLLDALASLQDQVENMNEMKKFEIEDLEANHKKEIVKIKNEIREETKSMYDKKFEELKLHYESQSNQIKENNEKEITKIKNTHAEELNDKDKVIQIKEKDIQNLNTELKGKHAIIAEKDKELLEKDKIIQEKERVINEKNTEISNLKLQMGDQNNNLHSLLSKFIERPSESGVTESVQAKANELERRLQKMEKNKAKFVKAYETKMVHMQREKHLAACSLQLQLVRQRAQVASELTEESHVELTETIQNLEAKYKDIVANVQSMALQRRMQDQMALDAMFQAVGCMRCDISANHSQFSAKTANGRQKDETPSYDQYDAEITGTVHQTKRDSKMCGDDSVTGGYCLDGERFGELFEKVHVPQRDINESKK